MKRSIYLFISSALLLVGCANIGINQKNYIGQDIRNVILDYGEPIHTYNMRDGIKAYQWEIISQFKTPVTANTTGFHSKEGIINKNTIYSGGGRHTRKCFYTFFTRRNKTQKTWIVTSFRKPISGC